MEAKQVRDLMEAYASVYQEKEEVSEDLQQKVGQALDAAAKNPVVQAIGAAIKPVGQGRKTPTKDGNWRPVVAKEETEEVEVVDEGRNTSLQALAREKHNKENPQGKFDRDKRLMMGHNSPGAYNYKKDPKTGSWSNEGRRDGATTAELRKKVSQRALRNRRGNVDAVPKKNGRPMFESAEDLFDYLLEYLVAEGYADTNKAALAIMANMSEEWKQSIVEQYGSIGANMAGAELQRRLELRVREQERKKIEQEKGERSGASSQVKGA